MGYILITGGNLKNKGAQAMIFITVDEMKKRFPEKEIIVISDPDAKLPEAEKERFCFLLRDSVCLYGSKYKLIQHRYGALDVPRDAARIAKQVDLVVDISGYTFGSNWGWMANAIAAYRAARAKKLGAPIYYMPQSFGPFDWRTLPERCTNRLLKKWLPYASVLYAREQEGYDLLKERYGFRNVLLSEDLVLQNREIDLKHVYKTLPVPEIPHVGKNSVAVLPNIRNYKYGNLEELLEAYRGLIDHLLEAGRTVYLVRHATEDLDFCRRIKAMYQDEERVILEEHDFTCVEYGDYVRQFDYLIASRYHAIVHAYKQGVPCIVLGWAIKYRELLNKFGQGQYMIDVRERIDQERLATLIRQMDTEYGAEAAKIRKALEPLQQKDAFDIIIH